MHGKSIFPPFGVMCKGTCISQNSREVYNSTIGRALDGLKAASTNRELAIKHFFHSSLHHAKLTRVIFGGSKFAAVRSYDADAVTITAKVIVTTSLALYWDLSWVPLPAMHNENNKKDSIEPNIGR